MRVPSRMLLLELQSYKKDRSLRKEEKKKGRGAMYNDTIERKTGSAQSNPSLCGAPRARLMSVSSAAVMRQRETIVGLFATRARYYN